MVGRAIALWIALCTVAVSLVACSQPRGGTVDAPLHALPSRVNPGSSITVVYCNGQVMKLTEPPNRTGLAPAVLYIHGGGWVGGDLRTGGFIAHLRPRLNAAGFVVASIDYRLAPEH